MITKHKKVRARRGDEDYDQGKKHIKDKVQIAMDSRSVQITVSPSVLPKWLHQSVSQAECRFQVLVKVPEKDKIKNLKLVVLLHGLPNKVSKLEHK